MFLLLLIVLVGSILIGWLVPLAMKSDRPFGLIGDIGISVIVGVGWTYILYQFIVPLVNLGGWLGFFGSALEGMAVAAVALWVLRRIKR